ncbi:hypothetical protein SAMN05518668_104406 [Sphingobium sp. YR657]|uniref:hypothetical protein n=1 Tax=Sphingobium sp. YR657 TaxID=1884366 RepID=UPI00091B1134|nr:hypothetical protein [Sphingobium sp. YR657]SHL97406.1 hypothetical protein SAMN05518668_104406 [Sphingobium sp. YR657]
MNVKEKGEALPRAVWDEALSCGDIRDRFPCHRCGATGPKGCETALSTAEVSAAVDYINGYGWKAALDRSSKPNRVDRRAAWHATREIGLVVLATVGLPSVAWFAPQAVALGAGCAFVLGLIIWGWTFSYRQKRRENERRIDYHD